MPITIPQTLELAGTLVNNLRDRMPDALYTAGVPQPDADGAIRAQTLYRWMTLGIRDMTRRMNCQVEDWWAVPLTAKLGIYALDARWRNVSHCFVSQYPCVFLNEPYTIYPAASVAAGSQSVTFGTHKLAGQLDVYLYPAPATTDPVTLLPAPTLSQTATTINLTSSTGFLSYGYAQIENELVYYSQLGTNQLLGCRRGVAGTGAVAHLPGVNVTHCGLWVKGVRSPNPVTVSTDPVELPYDALYGLETFVLAQYREFENSRAEAKSLLEEYREICESIKRDPKSQAVPAYAQVQTYGGQVGGGLGWYDGMDGVIVR